MVAVSFRGLLSLVDDPALEMEATITVGDGKLAIAVDHAELGTWKLNQCKAEKYRADEVVLTVETDKIIFRPPSPDAFLDVLAESRQAVRQTKPVVAEPSITATRRRQRGGRHRRSRFRTNA